jgi:hypothetical protein
MLFSNDRSLFYWTPIALLAFLASLAGLGRIRQRVADSLRPAQPNSAAPQVLLFVAFLVQVYALAGMWGKGEFLSETNNFAGVFLGGSFGFRDLTESLVVLAPGLAWFLATLRPRYFRFLVTLGMVLVAWNLVLVALFTKRMIAPDAGADLSTLLGCANGLISGDPFLLVPILEAPVLIGILSSLPSVSDQTQAECQSSKQGTGQTVGTNSAHASAGA